MKNKKDIIEVKESYLRKLLQAENPDEEELMKYFELDDNAPFSQNLKLKEAVQVLDEKDVVSLGVVLDLLNWNSRKNRKKKYIDFITMYPNDPKIVSEGDSWFQHPLVFDTIDHLLRWFPIYSIGAGGDTLRNIHRHPESLLKVITEEKPKLLLLSAGGNDILGDPQFANFLHNFSGEYGTGEHPERFLNERFSEEMMKLKNLYQDLCETLCTRFPNLEIIIHGYDYIIPNNPNVPWKLYQSRKKSWLGDPMVSKGITREKDKQAIINYILNLFNDILAHFDSTMEKVHYINLRKTVKPYQWHDEIHPNKDGYEDISLKIKAKIQQLLQ